MLSGEKSDCAEFMCHLPPPPIATGGETGGRLRFTQTKTIKRMETTDSKWSRQAESWHKREVDLVRGFPFVSEVFFFRESDE